MKRIKTALAITRFAFGRVRSMTLLLSVGEGYCKNLACSNGYIEIIFDKLLKDAARRNRTLREAWSAQN